jgi:hypothetical protein
MAVAAGGSQVCCWLCACSAYTVLHSIKLLFSMTMRQMHTTIAGAARI